MAQSKKILNYPITLGAANVPVKLSQTKITTTSFDLYVPASGSTIYLGDSNITTNAVPSDPGSITSCTASEESSVSNGDYFDLSSIYIVSATAGASAFIRYLASGE